MYNLKGNKDAQKFSPAFIISVFERVIQILKKNPKLIYIGEINLFLMENFKISPSTRRSWINNIHKNNKHIGDLWTGIVQILENRVVLDNEVLRPTIQAMVLQNKHNYRDRHDLNVGGQEDNPVEVRISDEQLIDEAAAAGLDLPPGATKRIEQPRKK